jgi:hypothetical protein
MTFPTRLSSIFRRSSYIFPLNVRRAVPGLLGRRDSASDILVGSVSYPELLDKLSESRVSVITLFKSIWLIGFIVSVSSLISSIEVIRGVEFCLVVQC